MTSKRLKNLARLRLILSVIAVLLAGLMIVSGVMHFGIPNRTAPEEPATEPPAAPTAAPTESSTEAPTEPLTEAPTESSVPSESQDGPKQGSSYDFGGKENSDTPSSQPPEIGSPPNLPEGIGSAPAEEPITETENQSVDESISSEDFAATGDAVTTDVSDQAGESNEANSAEAAPTETISTEAAPTETASTETAPTAIASAEAESSDVQPAATDNSGNKDIFTGEVALEAGSPRIWGIVFYVSAALLVLDLIAIVVISQQINKELKRLKRIKMRLNETDAHARQPRRNAAGFGGTLADPLTPTEMIQPLGTLPRVGTVHQVGRRDYQQDSLGHVAVLNNTGMLAVVADGMGGLSGGEKVSQKIVMDALTMANQLKPGHLHNILWKMLEQINENVNRLLGPDGLYKSGSTLVSVLVSDGQFQWISVGDSRIYLYREGYANQLNQDHDQLQVWMADVLSGRRTMEETLRNPDGRKLTSFIGMGQLKYVDGSRSPIPLAPGDRLVLMSDGIYGIVSEDRLAEILKRYPDVEQAATVIDRMIRDSNHPHQDNYTAIILGF